MDRHRPGHISWADLNALDLEGQTAFYEALFGLTHEDVEVDGRIIYKMMKQGGRDAFGIGPMMPDLAAQGVPSAWNTYVKIDSVDASITRATELGGRVLMDPMDVMESGRMALVADPTGASFGLWEPKEFHGAAVYEEPGTILYADVSTRDMVAAADFYEAFLGWEVDRSGAHDPDYWGASVDGDREVGIMRMSDDLVAGGVPAHWLLYLAADDTFATTRRVEELGGTIEMPPMDLPMATFSVVSDPAGATFALMTMKERPDA